MTLKELRIKSMLNQREFANYVGVTQQTISKIESGKSRMTAKTLRKLAKAFNLSEQQVYSLYLNGTQNP